MFLSLSVQLHSFAAWPTPPAAASLVMVARIHRYGATVTLVLACAAQAPPPVQSVQRPTSSVLLSEAQLRTLSHTELLTHAIDLSRAVRRQLPADDAPTATATAATSDGDTGMAPGPDPLPSGDYVRAPSRQAGCARGRATGGGWLVRGWRRQGSGRREAARLLTLRCPTPPQADRCKGCSRFGDTLWCNCFRNSTGQWEQSALSLSSCRGGGGAPGRISSANVTVSERAGYLTCDWVAAPPPHVGNLTSGSGPAVDMCRVIPHTTFVAPQFSSPVDPLAVIVSYH
jgi:hypothetical protein